MAKLKDVSLIEAILHPEKYEIMIRCPKCGHELDLCPQRDSGDCENCGEFVLRKDFSYSIFEKWCDENL